MQLKISRGTGLARGFGAALLSAAVALGAGDAIAAAAAQLNYPANVTRVANLEPVTTQYIVANPTNIFSNHFVYGTNVVGELARGTRVEALGKVPGYEWILVGRNGQPVGYVPISMLSPADLYVP